MCCYFKKSQLHLHLSEFSGKHHEWCHSYCTIAFSRQRKCCAMCVIVLPVSGYLKFHVFLYHWGNSIFSIIAFSAPNIMIFVITGDTLHENETIVIDDHHTATIYDYTVVLEILSDHKYSSQGRVRTNARKCSFHTPSRPIFLFVMKLFFDISVLCKKFQSFLDCACKFTISLYHLFLLFSLWIFWMRHYSLRIYMLMCINRASSRCFLCDLRRWWVQGNVLQEWELSGSCGWLFCCVTNEEK